MNFKRFGRTANLFDKNATDTSKGYMSGYYLTSNGAVNTGTSAVPFSISEYIEIGNISKITLSPLYTSGSQSPSICFYNSSKAYISGEKYNNNETVTFDVPNNATYFRFSIPMNNVDSVMVNSGSTALPYQPYKDWTDIPHYIMGTSTDTLTTLPADLYADGQSATVGLVGNMEQTGTPTPATPIQPQECGERTGNLFDKSQPSTVGFVREDGTINENNNYRISDYIQLLPNMQYTVSNMNVNGLYPAVCFYTDNKTYISGSKYDGATVFTFTTPSNCKYVLVSYLLSLVNNVMLNTGSTALPYEPYGQYKIPILSNSTTTPVYLGEVQTTRRIYKLVLTGDEASWGYNAQSEFFYLSTVTPDYLKLKDTITSFCSHYKSVAQTIDAAALNNGEQSFWYAETVQRLYIKDTNYTSITSFKQHLADQYAAGTPVTVWYVLATETTGIVNEPLRKIGTYADEVSGITIPTIAGANTLSIGTTLQPSEVTVNYKGWHPVTDVHERENGAWT